MLPPVRKEGGVVPPTTDRGKNPVCKKQRFVETKDIFKKRIFLKMTGKYSTGKTIHDEKFSG